MVKQHPALRRFAHLLDHGEIECYDTSDRDSSERGASQLGQHEFPWDEDNLGRGAVWHRLHQLGLGDDDIVIFTDADEILSRHTVLVMAACEVAPISGLGRLEMETMGYAWDCCAAEPLRASSIHDWLSVTAMPWSFAKTLGEHGLAHPRAHSLALAPAFRASDFCWPCCLAHAARGK